jgi:hypothetical protein
LRSNFRRLAVALCFIVAVEKLGNALDLVPALKAEPIHVLGQGIGYALLFSDNREKRPLALVDKRSLAEDPASIESRMSLFFNGKIDDGGALLGADVFFTAQVVNQFPPPALECLPHRCALI